MIKELTILQEDMNLIQSELEANKPYEACGVMIGTFENTAANVKKVIPVTNVRRTTISFELDPQEFYNAWNRADKSGNEIVGVYHSHPFSPGKPSSWDRDTMKNVSLVWLIAGTDGTFGYVYDDGIKNVNILVN
jgi:proteasome lid subunit RPN8/RPN11